MDQLSRSNLRSMAPRAARSSRRRDSVSPVSRLHPSYHWITITPGQHRFLSSIFSSFGFETLQVWIDAAIAADDFARTHCDGLVTCVGECGGRTVAIAWSDFRVNAACYGQANSQRFAAFIAELDECGRGPIPLVYVVNSAGISLMEGRRVFSAGFALWPALLDYAERHPVLTCAVGKCLGLAPLLYGLGHYRVAVAEHSQINLTGPEVIALFFRQGSDFARDAAAERFHERNDLVHELVPSVEDAFTRFRSMLFPKAALPDAAPRSLGPRGDALLASFLDAPPLELVPGWCESVRLLLGTRHGQPLGVFVNPQDRPNNLITVRTLEKYAAGLDLFRALRLPIISFLDSPGIDPRFDQSHANNFRKMLWVGEKIIRYPYGAMGVVAGRCFGGATTLVFPKVFGGARVIALRGSRIGAMNDSIIERLLSGSPRLLEQWHQVAAEQGPGFEDLLREGSLDAVIEPAELPGEIDRFLAHLASSRPAGAEAVRTLNDTRAARRCAPRPARILELRKRAL
jgi:acetyl-CoA carboxylase carboxyltransferase component